MLSLFPQLLFLSPFAALIIRLTTAGVFAYVAWSHFTQKEKVWVRYFSAFEILVATLLFIGLYTQLAAFVSLVVLAIMWKFELFGYNTPTRGITFLLMFVLCLSLTVMGAGPFALDLPL